MARSTPRIGLLTGGGDCPGLNAVLRAITKSLILEEGAEVIGFENGFEGLVERQVQPLSFRDVSGILTRGGTILGASNKANPFDYYRRGGADVSAQAVETYRSLHLDALVVVGGDGTMIGARNFQQLGLNIVGVPKTIDNDVVGTDHTVGFDTAVSIATDAIDRIHTTAQSHHRIMIIETMGRYAGWLALHAGAASGSDIILIPEVEYEMEEIVRVCRERETTGQRFTIIAVAEGAKPKGGEQVVDQRVEDSPDPIRLGGVGKAIERDLQQRVNSEVRTTVLGHMQRGGTPTPYDRNLATLYGAHAASLVAEESFGRMVGLQDGRLTSVPLETVAEKIRTVPRDAPILAAAAALGTSFGVADLEVSMPNVTDPGTG